MRDFFDKVSALRRRGEPFATATVVGRRKPVSGHLGDRAIVYADGRMEGFVGGACSREIVRRQALDTMRVRHARLVSIRPDAAAASTSDPEHVVVAMTCVSEGAVDVYVEPFVPARRLVVVGATPVAEALTRTAASLDYDVVRIVDAAEIADLEPAAASGGFSVQPLEGLHSVLQQRVGDTAAVVATQGHYDEQALEVILRTDVPYVGLVASRKRGASVRAFLEASGVSGIDRLRNPAGLDLGARTAPEVALSILAEIVQVRPSQALEDAQPERIADRSAPAAETSDPSLFVTAIDPVCNMDVEVATARYTAKVGGKTYYFCCAQCRTSFTKDPAQFGVAAS